MCNLVRAMTQDVDELRSRLTAWFSERLPSDWLAGPIEVDVDREEALVVLPLAKAYDAGGFRDATRGERMRVAQQAEETFGLKISWGTSKDGRRQLYTTVRSPVAVPLAMRERQILDSLVAAGVATDRTEAVAWCIRLVGHHESDWLQDLRDAVAAAPPGRRDRPVAI
ncbi:MAG: hypothetical protein QOE57_1484 [Acidimicrobiaceae bacterium]|jgi:hypothetical protein|nr:hypothetical protein [Acidimicrobiaceae bacterium]